MSVEGTLCSGVGVWCGVVRDVCVCVCVCVVERHFCYPCVVDSGGALSRVRPPPETPSWGLGEDGLTLVYLNYQVKAMAANCVNDRKGRCVVCVFLIVVVVVMLW